MTRSCADIAGSRSSPPLLPTQEFFGVHAFLDLQGRFSCKLTHRVKCVDCLKLHLNAGPKYIYQNLLGIQKYWHKRQMTSSYYYASKPNIPPTNERPLYLGGRRSNAHAFFRSLLPVLSATLKDIRAMRLEIYRNNIPRVEK